MPSIEEQIKLEYEMVQSGAERYDHQHQKQQERDSEANTKYGRAIISATVDKVAAGVREIQEFSSQKARVDIAYKKICDMDADKLAYLSLVTVVDCLSKRFTLLKIARLVGLHVELQDRLDHWTQDEGLFAKRIINEAKEKTGFRSKRTGLVHKMNASGYAEDEWRNEDRIHVGLRLIDKIISKSGIVRLMKMKQANGKTTTYIEATEETLEWIRNFNDHQRFLCPRFVPCVIPPKPWEDVWGGGFYSEKINFMPFVRVQ